MFRMDGLLLGLNHEVDVLNLNLHLQKVKERVANFSVLGNPDTTDQLLNQQLVLLHYILHFKQQQIPLTTILKNASKVKSNSLLHLLLGLSLSYNSFTPMLPIFELSLTSLFLLQQDRYLFENDFIALRQVIKSLLFSQLDILIQTGKAIPDIMDVFFLLGVYFSHQHLLKLGALVALLYESLFLQLGLENSLSLLHLLVSLTYSLQAVVFMLAKESTVGTQFYLVIQTHYLQLLVVGLALHHYPLLDHYLRTTLWNLLLVCDYGRSLHFFDYFAKRNVFGEVLKICFLKVFFFTTVQTEYDGGVGV